MKLFFKKGDMPSFFTRIDTLYSIGGKGMKIEMFTDFVCPFCYIGKVQLEKAIRQAGYEGQVEIEYKAYQLDPNAPKHNASNYLDSLRAKFDGNETKMASLMDSIQGRASEVGLTYNFEEMKVANTEKLHRLVKWAQDFKKGNELFDLLTDGYFTKGLDLNDENQVMQRVAQLGLDVTQAKEVYETEAYQSQIDVDRYDAMQIGVQSVPFFVFENRYGIIGAEPDEVFIKTLHQAAEIAGDKPTLNMMGTSGAACDMDGNCN